VQSSPEHMSVAVEAGKDFSLTAKVGCPEASVSLSRGDEELLSSKHDSPLCRVRLSDGEWRLPDLASRSPKLVANTQTGHGWTQVTIHAPVTGSALEALLTIKAYECAPVLEQRLELRNAGSESVRLTGIDTLALALRLGSQAVLRGFRSSWGEEFEPFETSVHGEVSIETITGRSSHGYHPWLSYEEAGHSTSLVVAPMWSGNWVCRAVRLDQDAVLATGGLSDREFWHDLEPGEKFVAPCVALCLEDGSAKHGGLSALGLVGRRHWYPQRPGRRALPVEWNHWFPYTDADISEDAFTENVDVAADLGIELCTLDAGWFGKAETHTNWQDWRGDWHLINTARFPGGLRPLAERCMRRELGFGIWCEIEGLGPSADVDGNRRDFEATRLGSSLGYVCFGNPAVRSWAGQVIDRLIEATSCRWIKFDFNVDPGYGCDRGDHGHGEGSGLYAHVMGYYSFLDGVRDRHPEVVLENCASGGLRIDLEMLRHLHVTYLSDLDWLDHSLQIFWGVTSMLHPAACLKFSYSEWIRSKRPGEANSHQNYNPRDLSIPSYETDTYLRTAMLHNFAVSQRLPEFPYRVARRLCAHVSAYKNVVRRFVNEGAFYRLTEQPLRSGGSRIAAFQYSLTDEDRHLVFVFRLEGKSDIETVRLANVPHAQAYTLSDPVDPYLSRGEERSGASLCQEGLDVSDLRGRESKVLLLEPVRRAG
jgi:alpha-galactosidase